MDPDAVQGVGREPHGGSDDRELLDFSANTNPEIPDGVRAVYEAALDRSRRYPPEPPAEFREAAAGFLAVEPGQVVPVPGGLAAIRLAVETAVGPGDTVLVPAPSFGEYAREVRLQGAEPTFVAHDEVLQSDPTPHALAVVCNPNNPTGDAYDDQALRSFASRCRATGTPLLVDEAFLGFTDRRSLAGVDGVVVARSLTKLFGLPGLRAGYAVATGDRLAALTAARRPWNVGTPARAVGTYCLRQASFVAETRKRVRAERERLRRALSGRFDVHRSDGPFLLVEVGDRGVDDVVSILREQGIAVRDARTFRGLDAHVRVAVRRPEENDRLLAAFDHV